MCYCYTFVLYVSLNEAGGSALNVVDSEVCLATTLYRDESETVQGSWTTTSHLEKQHVHIDKTRLPSLLMPNVKL